MKSSKLNRRTRFGLLMVFIALTAVFAVYQRRELASLVSVAERTRAAQSSTSDVRPELEATESALDGPQVLAEPALVGRHEVGSPSDPASPGSALEWRLDPLDGPDVGPLGTVDVAIRASGGHWTNYAALVVEPGGPIGFADCPSPPFEYRVTGTSLVPELYMLDDHGFVDAGARVVVLRASQEAILSVYSRATGEELQSFWVAEASTPEPGATPRFDSPGPKGFELDLMRTEAHCPTSQVADYRRPLVRAEGFAWRAIPRRVLAKGGRVYLDPGHEVVVHVNAESATAPGGIEGLSILLTEGGVSRWGACACSVALSRGQARNGRLDGAFVFEGLPVVIRCATAEARWTVQGLDDEQTLETARGAGTLTPEGDRIDVTIQPDTLESIVEGYVVFADEGVAERVTSVALSGVGSALHHESLFSRRLKHGRGLTLTEEGQLHWRIKDLRPGVYALLLAPLGIYCTLHVELTKVGVQTLVSEVPSLVRIQIQLLDSEGQVVTGDRDMGIASFIAGPTAERPTVVKPAMVSGNSSSSPTIDVLIPDGARCFVEISAGREAGRGEFIATDKALVEFQLERPVRWMTVYRRDSRGPAPAPISWWKRHLHVATVTGAEEAIIYHFETPTGPADTTKFTAWGVIADEAVLPELTVAVPKGGGTLMLRGAFPGTGDELIQFGPDDASVTIVVH